MDRQISIDDDSANMEDDSQDTAIDDSASDRVPTSQKNDSQGEQVIAKQETIDVFRLKLVVLLVLMVSAASIASAVFIYLSKAEQNQFEEEFLDQSHKVLEAIGSSLDKTFGLFDSVAVAFVSFARATNQKWPFVTMPDFALRMSKLLPLTDAVNINILPLVTSQNREAWEAYSLTNEHWINEGMAFQESWDGYHGPVVYNGTTNGVIHGDFGNLPYNVSRNFLPVWQNFPVIANMSWTYNYDWLSVSFQEAYMACLTQHKVVFSKPYMIPTPGDEVAEDETNIWADIFRDYINPDEEPLEPVCDISYPIVDEIGPLDFKSSDYNPANHSVVGMVGASMYWREIIQNVLPPGSNGITVVFQNACTEPFTYQVNGPDVVYLGVGDKHHKSFDRLQIHRSIDELFGKSDSLYSGAQVDSSFCPMTVHFYPSKIMESEYKTQNPMIFTVSVMLIFAFALVVFYFYDAKVDSRQKTVMQTATHSSAIVSSLFPSEVRDRLYPIAEEKFDYKVLGNSSTRPSDSPIAHLYPDTTVLFADLVGFTSWSATREPCQVFHLLETVYAGFDKIAKQRGVFKIETIGDCYVAVVGLPKPRAHHAVVMARFASECCDIMQVVVSDLETTLGPGTADLALRVGLNSGPTTAGVLRGDKSRFQLFGDTVNTAARMESSGEPNQIHISQKTAELLKLSNKGNWLTPREEQVDCKGKGLMTTYWCNVRSGSRTESVRSSNESRTEGKQADSKGAKDNHLEGEMEDRGIVQTTKLAPAQRSKDTNDENRTEI